jgi:hypothetical protein
MTEINIRATPLQSQSAIRVLPVGCVQSQTLAAPGAADRQRPGCLRLVAEQRGNRLRQLAAGERGDLLATADLDAAQ